MLTCYAAPGASPTICRRGEIHCTRAILRSPHAHAEILSVDDQLFQKGEIGSDRLTTETAAIAELQGRLRSVHLAAYLETKLVLRADQIAMYLQLRGYEDGGASGHRHHHG